jgi:hypothetical protein
LRLAVEEDDAEGDEGDGGGDQENELGDLVGH